MKTSYWIPDKHWRAFRTAAISYLSIIILVLATIQSVNGKGDVRRVGDPPPCPCGRERHSPIIEWLMRFFVVEF
jgi:hypothetical protein